MIKYKKLAIIATLTKICVDQLLSNCTSEEFLENITNVYYLEYKLVSDEFDRFIRLSLDTVLRKIESILEDIENGFYQNFWKQ